MQEGVVCRTLRDVVRVSIRLHVLKQREGKEARRVRSLPDLKAEHAGNQSERWKMTTYRKHWLGIRKSIEAALDLKKKTAEEIRQAKDAIDDCLAQIQAIKNELEVQENEITTL